jgi:hypothetical protein
MVLREKSSRASMHVGALGLWRMLLVPTGLAAVA